MSTDHRQPTFFSVLNQDTPTSSLARRPSGTSETSSAPTSHVLRTPDASGRASATIPRDAPDVSETSDRQDVDAVAPVLSSLAHLLGLSSRSTADWVPDEIPTLDGIHDIVLNFATNGLNWANGHRPVGVTIGSLDGRILRFLPFAFAGGNLDEAAVVEFLKREVRGKHLVNANTRFDLHMGRNLGIDFEAQGCTFSDVMHTAALLDDHRRKFALDELAADYLPALPHVARVDERGHHLNHASLVAERELFTAQLVCQLTAVMQPQIDAQDLRRVHDLEDAVIPCVVEMEKNGAQLDMDLLEQYSAECTKRHDALLIEIAHDVGFGFDHSAKSWQRLFERLGLPPTDGNDETTIAAIDHPIVKRAHLAAQYASLHSKTFKAYRENVDSHGVLRFDINQLRGEKGGTVSGRFSIGYVQQVPNHDNHFATFGDELFPRRLFVPARPPSDFVPLYLDADAAQIEYRLFAHYANNTDVIAAYAAETDDDPLSFHKMTWGMMRAYKADMLYTHQKSFNFAKQYGAKSIKLASMMGFITDDESKEIRSAQRWNDPRLKTIHEIEAAYKRIMPEGNALLDYAAHLAKPACDTYCRKGDLLHQKYPHRGFVKTLLGRRRRFGPKDATHVGLNHVLQGTGADIMKQKLVELHSMRTLTGFLMRLTIHDAVGGDAQTPETLRLVHEILNYQSFDLRVKIRWKCKTGKNWAECK